jgi:hypothetical protein
MKKKWISLLMIAMMILSIRGEADQDPKHPYLIYSLGNDTYSVVYLYENKEEAKKAKDRALSRAKELSCEKKCPFFSILSQENVVVLTAPSRMPDEKWYGDQYYDSLVQENFGPDETDLSSEEAPQTYYGFKIVIRCFKQRQPDSIEPNCLEPQK